jgi:RNA polymerase sigma factor (sigma-70 family)
MAVFRQVRRALPVFHLDVPHRPQREEHLLEAIDETKDQPEEIRLLYELIEGLDPLNKALVLLYLDGNNHQEIAEVLGISETNVATKISRLKSKMKQEFRGPGQAESQAKSRSET